MSHLTCGFDRVLREGVDQYEARILKRLSTADPKEKETLAGFLNVVASLRVWHGRYLSALSQRLFEASQEEKEYWSGLYETLCRVPFSSPRNFREARNRCGLPLPLSASAAIGRESAGWMRCYLLI